MANGDAAAAAGMDVVPASAKMGLGYDEMNKTRDYIAERTADVVPIDQGGTGATTAAAARTNLGLGTAAVEDAGTAVAPNTLVKRGSTGRISCAAPVSADNAVNLDYLEGNYYSRSASNSRFLTTSDGDSRYLRTSGGTVSGSLTVRSNFGVDGSLRAGGAWDNNITGTRRAVWMEADGTLGHASSARKYKTDIVPAELTLEQLRAIPVVFYRYISDVEAAEAGRIDEAPLEVGTIADDLDALGLSQFVVYVDGEPDGVHYDLLSVAAVSLAQQLADKLEAFDARLAALEGAAS